VKKMESGCMHPEAKCERSYSRGGVGAEFTDKLMVCLVEGAAWPRNSDKSIL